MDFDEIKLPYIWNVCVYYSKERNAYCLEVAKRGDYFARGTSFAELSTEEFEALTHLGIEVHNPMTGFKFYSPGRFVGLIRHISVLDKIRAQVILGARL